jgi:ABC-type transport system involved in cytochrome c biogenesis permease component
MTVLPIVGRELGVAAGRAATYWTRFAAGAVAVAVFLLLWLNDQGPTSELGRDLFNFLGILTLGFCLLAGVFSTADSLSVEKREGTLGLLFLTDLKGYDVVLGKLAANSVHVFFGLLAIFPVLALPLLIGGVSGGEFWRTALVFVDTLCLSLSVGMFVSAASREGRQAMAGTLAILVMIAGILPLLWALQSLFFHGRLPDKVLLWPNPAYAYYKGMDSEYHASSGPQEFWGSMSVIALLGTGCIVAASVMLPRSWQRTASGDARRKSVRFGFFGRGQRSRRRAALENGNPFHWLAMSEGAGQSALNRVVVALFLMWVVCAAMLKRQWFLPSMLLVLVFGMHLAAKVLMASESGRRFHQDRQSGALELLMVTPLSVEAIVAGQRDALRRQFRFSIWMLCVTNVLTGVLITNMRDKHEVVNLTTLFLGGAMMLWLDSVALSWVGMWKGLKARKHPRSVLATLGQVIGLPWLAGLLFIYLCSNSNVSVSEGGIAVVIGIWFWIGAVIDGVSMARARAKLVRNFRAIVAQRYNG